MTKIIKPHEEWSNEPKYVEEYDRLSTEFGIARMSGKQLPSVSTETFDDFLAEQGLLQACENHAIKEISEGLNEVGLMDKDTSVADLLTLPQEAGEVDFYPPRLTAKLFRPAEF